MNIKYRLTNTGNIILEVSDHDLLEIEKVQDLFRKQGLESTVQSMNDCEGTWAVAVNR